MKIMLKKLALLSGFVLFVGLLSMNLGPKEANAYLQNPALGQLDAGRNSLDLFVYNEDNVAHEVGDVVIFVSTATNGIQGISVTTTTTQADAQVAGIVVNTDIAATSWGKIRVYGYVPIINMTGTCVVGGALLTATAGETSVSTATINAGEEQGKFGVTLTADDDGTCTGILK